MFPKKLIFVLVAIVITIAGYFGIAYYLTSYRNISYWPFEAPILSPAPLLPPKTVDLTSTPTPIFTEDPQSIRLKEAIVTRDAVASYLIQVEPLYAAFDTYLAKSQLALQNRSLPNLTASRQDLELIRNRWKILVPPPILGNVHQIMLGALDDEMRSNMFAEEGIRNRDNAKLLEAIRLADEVAAAVERSNDELRRITLEVRQAVEQI